MFVNPLRASQIENTSSASNSNSNSENDTNRILSNNSTNLPTIVEEESSHFITWISAKKDTLTKKHCILTKKEYNELVYTVNNYNIAKKSKNLLWAVTYIKNNNVHKYVNLNGDIIPGHEIVIPSPKNNGEYLRFAYVEMMENAIKEVHVSCGHRKSRSTHNKLSSIYANITREIVEEFCERCVICKDSDPVINRAPKVLHPIISPGIFQHIVIDLVDFSSHPCGNFVQVLHIIDHLSSYHFVSALTSKTAIEVLHSLRATFSIIGHPQIVQSDNGGEFNNHLLADYFIKYNIQHRNSKPYSPATNGKVERANRTLKNIINNLMKEKSDTWYNVLYEAAFILNTSCTRSIKMSPYEFVFGHKPKDNTNVIDFGDEDSLSTSFASSTPSPDSTPISSPLPTVLASSSGITSNINLQLDNNYLISREEAKDDNNVAMEEEILNNSNEIYQESSSIIHMLADVESQSTARVTSVVSTRSNIRQQTSSSPTTAPQISTIVVNDDNDVNNIEESIDNLNRTKIKQIRDIGTTNYINNSINMIRQVNKKRGVQTLSEGDIVGIYIPQDYRMNGIKRLPAVIINQHQRKDNVYFQLVHRKYLIEGWYQVHDFELLNKDSYANIVGLDSSLEVYLKEYKVLISKKKLHSLPLRSIYLSYVANYTTYYTESLLPRKRIDDYSIRQHQQKKQRVEDQVLHQADDYESKINEESICATCHLPILGSSHQRCNYCNSSIHLRSSCYSKERMIIQSSIKDNDIAYCSNSCFLKEREEIISSFATDDEEEHNADENDLVYRPGTILYLKIPAEIIGETDVTMIPVVVLERDVCGEDEPDLDKYSVEIAGYTIEGWYYSSQLVYDESDSIPLSLFNLKNEDVVPQNVIDCWGYVIRGRKRFYKYVSLETAFALFCRTGGYDAKTIDDKAVIYKQIVV